MLLRFACSSFVEHVMEFIIGITTPPPRRSRPTNQRMNASAANIAADSVASGESMLEEKGQDRIFD